MLGETSPEENQEVTDWIAASPENEQYFSEFKLIWDKSQELAAVSTVDVDAAWEKMKGKILATREPVERTGTENRAPVIRMGLFWKRVAAILVVVITGLVAWMLYRNAAEGNWKQVASTTAPIEQLLPDSSKIILNKESVLEYTSGFKSSTRQVRLKGEAFFEVKRNPDKPFKVEVDKLIVTVLGTSFNIREADSAIHIIVETGKVRVSNKDQYIDLLAGEQISIEKGQTTWLKTKQSDKLYQYYRTRSFNCDNTPLWKLVEVLNNAYDTTIVIKNPAIKHLPLTTVFEEQPLDEILSVIQQTLDLTITQKADTIYVE